MTAPKNNEQVEKYITEGPTSLRPIIRTTVLLILLIVALCVVVRFIGGEPEKSEVERDQKLPDDVLLLD